ncbi:uncharacterized protein LOC103317949 [Nasonia vitripennis]|uniref:Exonuclease domain-containing protein n=1 Tax=Nasonia vitripennis TaxID=7425 RepID=A0A7M7HDP9_NASVI|nr:uncharacterized protein LOC103317949 [Nasonia vitripennis]
MAGAPTQYSNVAIAFFDLETGGFYRDDDILQISMKCGSKVFNRYANPTKYISPGSSLVHGLTNDGSALYHRRVRVQSSPLQPILLELLHFLEEIVGSPCVLVAHNCNFDSSRLLIKIRHFNLLDQFRQVVVGFTDSLSLFKKRFPGRREKGSYKLTTLAKDFIGVSPKEAQEYAHDAMYDVKLLEKLVNNYIAYDDIVQSHKSFDSLVELMHRKEESIVYLQSLRPLAGVVSKPMLERMAYAHIDFDSLLNAYQTSERFAIDLLERRVDGRPQVIKTRRIIDAILNYLRSYDDNHIDGGAN